MFRNAFIAIVILAVIAVGVGCTRAALNSRGTVSDTVVCEMDAQS